MPLKMGMQVGLIAQRSQVLPFPPPYLMIPWMCYHFKNQVRETSRSKREGRDIFINQTCGRRWETSIPSPCILSNFHQIHFPTISSYIPLLTHSRRQPKPNDTIPNHAWEYIILWKWAGKDKVMWKQSN